MTAEVAMKEIDQILDEYIEAKISEQRALSRIARVIGQYGWSNKS